MRIIAPRILVVVIQSNDVLARIDEEISAVIVDLFGPGQKLPRPANAHRT